MRLLPYWGDTCIDGTHLWKFSIGYWYELGLGGQKCPEKLTINAYSH